MMSLHKSGETTSLAGSDDMDEFVLREDVDHHLVAGIGRLIACEPDLAHEPRWGDVRFLEESRHRLVYTARLHELYEPELRRVVSVLLLGLLLNNDARSRLNDRYGHNDSIVSQELR